MKLATIIDSQQALEVLLKQNLPIDIAWKIKTFIAKSIRSELESYEAIRIEKIKSYGEIITDEKSPIKGQYQVLPENLEIFMKELGELREKEIAVIPPVIKISEIIEYNKKSPSPIVMTTNDLLVLDWLIVE